MAQSKQFQEILDLGKTLVTLFSEHGRTDLTTSWMAHYLAEIMQQASVETNTSRKRALEKECSEIILDLWEKRRYFPQGIAPLSGVNHAVAVIKALKDEQSDDLYWRRLRGAESDSVWGSYIYNLRNAVEDALKITLSAAVTKSVLDREKRWAKHEAFLLDEEKEIIDFLDTQLDKDDSLIKIIYSLDKEPETPKATPDKMTKVFTKLRELLNRQTAALNKLEEEIIKPKKATKRPVQTRRKSL
jgi:hypothetical protein